MYLDIVKNKLLSYYVELFMKTKCMFIAQILQDHLSYHTNMENKTGAILTLSTRWRGPT